MTYQFKGRVRTVASGTCPNNQEPQFLHFKRTKAKRLCLNACLNACQRFHAFFPLHYAAGKDGATVLVDRFPRPCENKGVGVGEGGS